MFDDETGLYYCNARIYNPKIVWFLQEDTVNGDPNDPLSLNLYTYSFNNPLKYYDPTGHWPDWGGFFSSASSWVSDTFSSWGNSINDWAYNSFNNVDTFKAISSIASGNPVNIFENAILPTMDWTLDSVNNQISSIFGTKKLDIPSFTDSYDFAKEKATSYFRGQYDSGINTCESSGMSLFDLNNYRADNDLVKQVVNKKIKVGRNDPCPCGSGEKYKKCCGQN